MSESSPRFLLSHSQQVILSEVRGDRYTKPQLPEHDCPSCGTGAGRWCQGHLGGTGWQHRDRPRSSWETK